MFNEDKRVNDKSIFNQNLLGSPLKISIPKELTIEIYVSSKYLYLIVSFRP